MTAGDLPLRNWAGNVTFGARHVHRPASLDELRRLVASSERIRALGTAHSFSRIADTTGDLVRVDGLPGDVEIDRERSTATVPAGRRYADVAVALERAGYALANMASLPQISVAGACATGTHGSGHTLPSLAGAVAGLRLVGPDGGIVDIRRDTDPGAIVALGALGVVTSVTLDIEPTFQVAQRIHLDVPLPDIVAGFDAVFGAAYSVSVFTDWASDTGAVWLKRRMDQPEPAWTGGTPADRQVHPVPGMPTEFTTPQLGVPGPWHQRLPHFRAEFTPSAGDELQSEFWLPRTNVGPAFDALRSIGGAIGPVLHVSEVRTVRGDDLWLSPAYHRDTVTLHFTWHQDADAVAPVLAEIERLLLPLGARPHWGKITTLPPATTIASYERAADFAALLRQRDPDGKFRNSTVDEMFPSES